MTVAASMISSVAASALLVSGLSSGDARSAESISVASVHGDVVARLEALSSEINAMKERAELAPVSRQRLASAARAADVESAERPASGDEASAHVAAEPATPSGSWPGGHETAHGTIQAILQLGTESEEAADLFAQAAEAGQLHELLAAMEEAMEDVPESADKHFDRATAYYGAARALPSNVDGNWWVDSNNAFTKALEYDPEHWKARYSKARNMAFWPVAYGGQAEAIRHFETLAEQQESGLGDPSRASDHPKTYVWLGNLYAQQGRTDEARAAWQRGLAAFPGDAWLAERLASLR
ncbi:MAG: tetratricopeptide repeat protein [Planctomycetota bacterium]